MTTVTTTAGRLAAKEAKNTDAAVGVYRAAVAAEAEGQPVPAKDVDKVADALAELDLTAADFKADVHAYKGYLAAKRAADALPSLAEADAAERQRVARLESLKEQIEALQKELRQAQGDFWRISSGEAATRQRVNTSADLCPRMFGPWRPPVAAKPREHRWIDTNGIHGSDLR